MMEAEETTSLVQRLIARQVPQLGSTAADKRAFRLLTYVMRILGKAAASGSAVLLSAPQCAELLRRRLTRSGHNAQALELTEHLRRLQALGVFEFSAGTLQLLCMLMHAPKR